MPLSFSKLSLLLTASILWLGLGIRVPAAILTVVEIAGDTLQGNPLGDPPKRHLAIFVPDGKAAADPLPLVVYLPGWGGSCEDAIAAGKSAWFFGVIDHLAAEGLPLRLAVVDARSRYGGTQYLNSAATGKYEDYVCDEVVKAIEGAWTPAKDAPIPRVIAGHSSGGYGALALGMSRHSEFTGVIALSPDSDFATTHKPFANDPAVRALTQTDLDLAMAPPEKFRLPVDGTASMMLGLSANYVPTAGQPGRFDWLYDAQGQWRPEIWQRWLDLDPLVAVRRRADAFAPEQRIYLDGAEHDEFGANIGARKIFEVLRERKSPVAFTEPPGSHGDNLPGRLEAGLEWVFGMPAVSADGKRSTSNVQLSTPKEAGPPVGPPPSER